MQIIHYDFKYWMKELRIGHEKKIMQPLSSVKDKISASNCVNLLTLTISNLKFWLGFVWFCNYHLDYTIRLEYTWIQ